MDPFGKQVLKIIGPVVGATIALLPSFFRKLNEWRRKPRFELKFWCVPVFGQPGAANMYCIAKLKVLKRTKGHEWLYLYPKTIDYSSVVYSQSRVGIGCKTILDKGFSVCQLRKYDEVDLRFLLRQENAVADPNSFTKMVDYHLSPKIRRRKLNISIDVLPE